MRTLLKLSLAATLAVVPAASSLAGNELIVIRTPFTTPSLAGSVKDPNGDAMKGVRVEDCTKGWKVTKDTTNTDEAGHFAFPAGVEGMHYLKLSADGMNSLLVRVNVSATATQKLVLKMYVAT